MGTICEFLMVMVMLFRSVSESDAVRQHNESSSITSANPAMLPGLNQSPFLSNNGVILELDKYE